MLKGPIEKKIKTMNNKMAINTYLATIDSKNQTKKTEEQRQNYEYGGHFDGCEMGGGCWRIHEEGRGLRSTNR